MANTAPHPPTYTEIAIRLRSLQADGYPIEVAFDGNFHSYGTLPPDVATWDSYLDPQSHGERLFQALMGSETLRADWAAAWGHSQRRRIRLGIDLDAPELHTVPWELLRDASPGRAPQALAADEDTPFSRYLPSRWNPGRQPAARPVRLLVAIATPQGLERFGLSAIDASQERTIIQQSLAGFPASDLVVSYVPEPVTLEQLEIELRKGCDILHILAHGAFDDQTGEAVLFLADTGGNATRVKDSALAEMLAHQDDPPALVFLASCQSAARSSFDAYRGLAPRLVGAGVPAVLAMQSQVAVQAVRTFTATFYSQLLRHGSVDLAANQARSTLISSGDMLNWGVPVLYSQTPSGAIVAPRPPARSLGDRLRRAPLAARVLAVGGLLFSMLLIAALAAGPERLCTMLDRIGARPAACLGVGSTPALGFRVGVAEFQTIQQPGQPQCAADAVRLSDWLAGVLAPRPQDLSSSVPYNVIGPANVGRVTGSDAAARDQQAQRLADKLGATVLIYGVISANAAGKCQIEPAFYVTPAAISYAPEIAGSSRLGTPIEFSPPLEIPSEQAAVNHELATRAQVLRLIVLGLQEMYISNFAAAAERFSQALARTDWAESDGQEVAYLLKGAAELRRFNETAAPEEQDRALTLAWRAFDRARQIDSAYARPYLGLGAVALQQARPSMPCEIDTAKLAEARKHYELATLAQDQGNSDYALLAAEFGLGQVHLAGAIAQSEWRAKRCTNGDKMESMLAELAAYSDDQAQAFFKDVIQKVSDNRGLNMDWHVANSLALLGAIELHRENWMAMRDRYQQAIDSLQALNDPSQNIWIAHYHAQVGYAESRLAQDEPGQAQDHLLRACTAYRGAIRWGQGQEVDAALADWRSRAAELAQQGVEECSTIP